MNARAPTAALAVFLACAPRSEPATVLAASSLAPESEAVEAALEAALGRDVAIAFAGSQQIAAQVAHGAPAAAVVLADADHARGLQGFAPPGTPWLCNDVIIASRDPLPDAAALAHARRIVVGDAAVPIGAHGRALLDALADQFGATWRAEVEAKIVSRELNARTVAMRLRTGDADAAIVYRSDLAGDPTLRELPLPAGVNATARYVVLGRDGEEGAAISEAFRGETVAGLYRARGFRACTP